MEPPENVQEKIAFIFNNLSQSNMTQKASMEEHYKINFNAYSWKSILKWWGVMFLEKIQLAK